MYKSADVVGGVFAIVDPATGALVAADAPGPSGTLEIDGVDSVAAVTIGSTAVVGKYTWSCTLPAGIVDGTNLEIWIAATVTVAGGNKVWQGAGVSARPAEVLTAIAALSAAISALTTNNVGVMTVTQSAEPFEVNEGSSAKLQFTLLDQNGVAVAASALATFKITLYDHTTGSVINARNNQDAKNANQVTVSESGVVTWSMLPADNVIVRQTVIDGIEEHRALFVWTWDTGAKSGSKEFRLAVLNIQKLPVPVAP